MARIQYVEPDVEVRISTAGSSNIALVAGLFVEEDGTTDVGVGWDGYTDLHGLCAILDAVKVALQSNIQFTGLDRLDVQSQRNEREGDELPFG